MDIDKLKEQARNLDEAEHEAIFNAGQMIGEAIGRKSQVLDLIRKFEEDRKVVNIAGKSAETAAKDPKPEKR